MFSEKEMKHLKVMTSRKFTLALYVIIIFTGATLLLSGGTNIVRANHFAQMINLSSFDILVIFLKGFDVSENYSGYFCVAFQMLLAGMIQIVLAAFCFSLIPLLRTNIRKNIRVIELVAKTRDSGLES